MSSSSKKARLIKAAKSLIHQQGFGVTTLADISDVSGVPLGNIYYYFKTKEDLGAAVIEERRDSFTDLFAKLEHEKDPRTRLIDYIDAMNGHRQETAKHGCPVGSLCQELAKTHPSLAEKIDAVIQLQLEWASRQFELMGESKAQDYGMQMITTLHGASIVSNALKNETIMSQQAQRLQEWIRAM